MATARNRAEPPVNRWLGLKPSLTRLSSMTLPAILTPLAGNMLTIKPLRKTVSVMMTAKCRLILMTFWSGQKLTLLKLNPAKCQAIQICFMRNPSPILTLKLVPNPHLLFHLPMSGYLIARGPQTGLLNRSFVWKCQQKAVHPSHPQEIWF